MPVLDDGPDDVDGFVHVKRAFAVALENRHEVSAAELMFPPTRVPETMPASKLLAELRTQGLQIAVVTDEHGGTAGIVTLEDLVEELVGELEDEHDQHPLRDDEARPLSFLRRVLAPRRGPRPDRGAGPRRRRLGHRRRFRRRRLERLPSLVTKSRSRRGHCVWRGSMAPASCDSATSRQTPADDHEPGDHR